MWTKVPSGNLRLQLHFHSERKNTEHLPLVVQGYCIWKMMPRQADHGSSSGITLAAKQVFIGDFLDFSLCLSESTQ